MHSTASAVLARCYPFNQINEAELAPYLKRMEYRHCKRGQSVLRNAIHSERQLTYLVSGVAELRRSFFDRQSLQAGDDAVLQPLDNLLPPDGGQIVAIDECDAVIVSREVMDEVIAARTQRDLEAQALLRGKNHGVISGKSVFLPGDVSDVNLYGVRPISDSDFSDEFRVSDGDVDVDWMSRFLQSPLAHQLPAIGIQQLLACLVSIDVAKGDTVIRRGESGDAMYVLTHGVASVRTDFSSAEFPLIPGDYFGEESLVADTLRNASVVMESDGSVAKLDRAAFMELIYPYLVRTADAKLTVAAQQEGADALLVIDVRFPVECRRQPWAGSRNIPISALRAAFSSLPKTQPCVVVSCGGRRSELAVFLLRQAGFDAYLLNS